MNNSCSGPVTEDGFTRSIDEMNRHVPVELIAIAALFLAGCTYIHVSDGVGTLSPDGRFRLTIGVDGSYAQDYFNKTKKRVEVVIGNGNATTNTPLLERSYKVTGAEVAWQTHWWSDEAVSIEVFDWGDGVSNFNNVKHRTASNHIASFSFILDKKTGTFKEQKPEPAEDLSAKPPKSRAGQKS